MTFLNEENLSAPFNFYQINQTRAGMARPAYDLTSYWETARDVPRGRGFEGISAQIQRDLTFLYEKKVSHIISLSNRLYHTYIDPHVEKIWTEAFGGTFTHIPTEDHVHGEDAYSPRDGEGVTAEKLLVFYDLIKNSIGLTVVYCGMGEGRTGAYWLAAAIADEMGCEEINEEALNALIDGKIKELGDLFERGALVNLSAQDDEELEAAIRSRGEFWVSDVESSGVRAQIPLFLELLRTRAL